MSTTVPGSNSYSPGPAFTISSGYGTRTNPVTGTQEFHSGQDYAAAAGTGIPAASNGTVIYSGMNGSGSGRSGTGYGYTVIVQSTGADGQTYYTLYAHMDGNNMPAVGASVTQGQTIGEVGNTGKSTGPHLHFEVLNSNANPTHASGGSTNLVPSNQSIHVDPNSFADWNGGSPYRSGTESFVPNGTVEISDVADNNTGDIDAQSEIVTPSYDVSDTVVPNGTDSIVIYGNSPSQTTNNSAVYLASGAIAQINGNGDTISGGNGFSATIVGDGSTANIDSGSGNQISISSGTVWMNSNTGATVNGPGDKITTNSGDVVTVNGSNNPIMEAGNNVVVNANASGDTGDTVTIQGSSDTANVANGNTVNINSGSGNNVNLSSGTVWMNSGAATTVTGSGDNITTSGTDNVALTGSGNTVQAQGDNIGVYSTYSNNISTSGNGDSFTLGAGSWVGIGSGRLDNITMSGTSASSMNGLWMNSNTDATVTGNYDSLLTNAGDTVKMMGSGDSLYADGTTGVVVAGNGAYGTSDSVTVTGDSDVLLADNARADIYSSGAGLNVSVGQNDNVGIHSSGITYTAFDGTDGVWLGGNLSNLLFRGNGETIHADLSGDVATVAGTNILVDSTAAGNTFSVNGQHDTLDASNDTINLAQSTLAYVAGTSDSISAYNNDAIAVSSPTDTVTVNGFVQELVSQTSTGSGLDFFNDLNYAGTSQINWLYNQPNAGGQLTSLDANWTAGGSQNIIYSYSTSGLETGFTVTDTNASGSILGTGSYNASGSLLSITGSYSGYTNFSDAGNAFGAPQVVGKGKHVDVSTIVNFDNSHGNSEAAAAAQSAAAWVGTLETNEPTMSDVAKKHAVFEGGRWNGTTITWSIGRGSGPSPFSGQLGSQYEAIVQQAFAAWGKASGLTFQEVSDAPHADINIGWSKFDPTNSGLIGYTSGGKQGGNLQQGVTIQLEDPTEDQLTAGADGQLVYQGTQANFYGLVMHEIGHALGLADNADPNSVMYYAGGTGTFDGDDLTGVTALYGGMAGNAGPSISMPTAGASSSDVSLLQFVQAVASMSSRTAPVSPQGTTPFDFSHGDPVRPGWITTPPHAHAA